MQFEGEKISICMTIKTQLDNHCQRFISYNSNFSIGFTYEIAKMLLSLEKKKNQPT